MKTARECDLEQRVKDMDFEITVVARSETKKFNAVVVNTFDNLEQALHLIKLHILTSIECWPQPSLKIIVNRKK